MSDYYDMEKPYSLANWNKLIEDVNEILSNPPAGSDCEPVEELEPVEDPHKWYKVEDIMTMREALEKTCPDISFYEELNKWNNAIIDEIEEEMYKAWCDCASGPVHTYIYYSVDSSTAEATPSSSICCGITTTYGTGVLCESPSYQEVYTSPTFTLHACTNQSIEQDARNEAYEAFTKTRYFIDTWNVMIVFAKRIHTKQSELNTLVATVDGLISDYEDCLLDNPDTPATCDSLKPAICAAGKLATDKQAEVTEEVSNFNASHPELIPAKEAADRAAQRNFMYMAQLIPHYNLPGNENMTSILAGYLIDLRWDHLIDPKDNYYLDYVNKYYNKVGAIIPNAYIASWTYPPDLGRHDLDLDISPGGYPFAFVPAVLTDVVNFYFRKEVTVLHCEQWPGYPCKCQDGSEVSACEACPPVSYGGGGYLWNNCDPTSFFSLWFTQSQLDYYISATMRPPNGLVGDIYTTPLTTDHTQDQLDYIDTYSKWLETHEPYDDRHEAYC